MFEYQPEEIERVLSTKVYNTYGYREFMLKAAECERQKGLHNYIDHLVVKTIDNMDNSVAGKNGDLRISDLSNYGMPLIRYKNGDTVTLSQKQCDCGKPLPLIEAIDGRKLDVIKTRSGAFINGVFSPHMFKEFRKIKKFQVKQTDINSVNILLVVAKDYSSNTETHIEKEINKYTNKELAINFHYLSKMPLTLTGKLRFILSELEE